MTSIWSLLSTRRTVSGATDGSGQTDEPTKSRFSEHQWYDSIRTMSEVGDLDEIMVDSA